MSEQEKPTAKQQVQRVGPGAIGGALAALSMWIPTLFWPVLSFPSDVAAAITTLWIFATQAVWRKFN